jgi:hypothetical protein
MKYGTYRTTIKISSSIFSLPKDLFNSLMKRITFIFPHQVHQGDRTHVAGIPLENIFEKHELSYWWQGSRWPEERIPKLVFPFFVWEYSESQIREEVVRLGLIPPGADSPLLTNSKLIPLLGVVDIFHLGYASFEPEFSRLVREGKTEKGLWRNIFELLEYSARTGHFISASVNEALARLGLTREEVGIKR